MERAVDIPYPDTDMASDHLPPKARFMLLMYMLEKLFMESKMDNATSMDTTMGNVMVRGFRPIIKFLIMVQESIETKL